MEFKGQHGKFQLEKLPDGMCQIDRNSQHHKRGLWQPRQGLSRPSGLGVLSNSIHAVGFGECGLKTGLMIAHGDKVEGYSIGRDEITPVWTPPPPIDFVFEVPEITVTPSDEDEVLLTVDITGMDGWYWITGFNWYMDGIFLDFTTDPFYLVEDVPPGPHEFQVEGVTENGGTTVRSRPVTYDIGSQLYVSDNFNRPNEQLTDSPNWASLAEYDNRELSVRNNQCTQDPPTFFFRNRYTTLFNFPCYTRVDLDWGGMESPQNGIMSIGFLTDAYASVIYSFNYQFPDWMEDTWRVTAGGNFQAQISPIQRGLPPNGVLQCVVEEDGTVRAHFAGLTVVAPLPAVAPIGYPHIGMNGNSIGLSKRMDDWICIGRT